MIIAKKTIYPIIMLFMAMSAANAQGVVVQSAGQALSFNNYIPPSTGGESVASSKSDKDAKSQDSQKKLRVVDKTKFRLKAPCLDVSNHYNKSIKVRKDDVFEISLAEKVNTKWIFEYDKKFIQVLDERKEGEVLFVTLKALKEGDTRLYMDSFKRKSKDVKVLESKIFSMEVR